MNQLLSQEQIQSTHNLTWKGKRDEKKETGIAATNGLGFTLNLVRSNIHQLHHVNKTDQMFRDRITWLRQANSSTERKHDRPS